MDGVNSPNYVSPPPAKSSYARSRANTPTNDRLKSFFDFVNPASEFHAYLDATLVTEDNAARESLCWQELCHSPLASNEFLFRI